MINNLPTEIQRLIEKSDDIKELYEYVTKRSYNKRQRIELNQMLNETYEGETIYDPKYIIISLNCNQIKIKSQEYNHPYEDRFEAVFIHELCELDYNESLFPTIKNNMELDQNIYSKLITLISHKHVQRLVEKFNLDYIYQTLIWNGTLYGSGFYSDWERIICVCWVITTYPDSIDKIGDYQKYKLSVDEILKIIDETDTLYNRNENVESSIFAIIDILKDKGMDDKIEIEIR